MTAASVLAAMTVIVAALAMAWLFNRFVGRLRRNTRAATSPALYVAGQVGRYIIIFIGLMIAGSVMGLYFTSLSLFAGALGGGIGLGVQEASSTMDAAGEAMAQDPDRQK